MGFNNKGLEEAVKRLKKRKNKVIVGGNIGKNTNTPNELAINDYLACFEGLYPYVDYITVNVSCPNITNLKKLQDQEELEKILQAIDLKRASTSIYKPVLLKISPDLNWDQIDETLAVIQRCHIDGIVAVNTTTIRKGLKTPENKVISIGNGGLSGLPLKDRSTEIIRYIHQKTKGKLPIIGVGGIENAEDAITKLEAGATLLQVYTGFIYKGPILAKSINYMCKFYI
jgi:dihydroorotate dehydrogenase